LSADELCKSFLYEAYKECINSHTSCRQNSSYLWIPTRLLDAQGDSIRLVERHELQLSKSREEINYTTLSHVWGNQKFLTLTKSNLEELKSGIDLPTLPQSFQDAILVTRELKVQYIWIDSLW
jgi:hypothetical protein